MRRSVFYQTKHNCAEQKASLEFLSIDLISISAVQNVSIDIGYHVDLGMACIALGGFQIAVIQFQFVGGTWNDGEK